MIKGIKSLTGNSWCTRGNAGWQSRRWVCESAQPRVGWCRSKAQGVIKTRDQPAWKTIPKRLGADAQPRLTLGYQLDHVCKKWKALELAKPNTFQIDWTIHFEERIPKNLLLRKVSLLKVCELKGNTFPNLGKVTSVGTCPKKIPIENFRVRSDLQKSSIFH